MLLPTHSESLRVRDLRPGESVARLLRKSLAPVKPLSSPVSIPNWRSIVPSRGGEVLISGQEPTLHVD